MTASHAHYYLTSARTRRDSIRRWLLISGIVGAVLYPLTDIVASLRYPGFSYRDMAVSELFAIGAPTSTLVVRLFTLSSALLLMFAIGMWMSANERRLVKAMSLLMALNTLDALALWNFFPMHMRGEDPTFTDTMHGILAIDPFLLAVMVLGAIAIKGRFRVYTIVTIVFSSVLIIGAIPSMLAFLAHQPTPWMGAMERAGQYANNLWYATLAIVLLRGHRVIS